MRVHRGGDVPPMDVSIPESWVDVLDEAVRHRGPDGHGRFRERVRRADGTVVDVALVHRRLSIIDIEGGHQPMVLGGGEAGFDGEAYRATRARGLKGCPRCSGVGRTSVAVVFNGCVYNHRELRKELEALGHVFSTDHSDTEVLVHGWSEWRGEWPSRAEGMFSAGIWDGSVGRVYLYRDPFGEKPLFFERLRGKGFGGESVAFCSSATGLLRVLPLMSAAHRNGGMVRPRSLARWIRCGYGQRPTRDVRLALREDVSDAGWRLRTLSWRRLDARPDEHAMPFMHRPRPRFMYPIGAAPRDSTEQFDPASAMRLRQPQALDEERADTLLRRAVERRIEADVPLGCFLSGGIDSALVTWHASRLKPDLIAFTVRMPDRRYDESEAAAETARLIGVRHVPLDPEPNPAEDLCRLIRSLGQPYGDSSLLPTYWLSRAVRQHAAVALSGDGGDELFCGYDRYATARWFRYRVIGLAPAAALPSRDPRSVSSKARRLLLAIRSSNVHEISAIFPEHDLREVMAGPPRLRHRFEPRNTAAAMRSWDLVDYLPDDLLMKVDTASMLVALEVRAPFLDHDLAMAAMDTPIHVLMPRGERKGLLRAIARRYFPGSITNRPKMGFAIPIGEWFRTDYGGMRQLLMDHLESSEPFGPDWLGINAMIDMGYVRRMVAEHDAAGEKSIWPWKGRDHSQRLYMVLVLSIWGKWMGEIGGHGHSAR